MTNHTARIWSIMMEINNDWNKLKVNTLNLKIEIVKGRLFKHLKERNCLYVGIRVNEIIRVDIKKFDTRRYPSVNYELLWRKEKIRRNYQEK